MNSTVTANQMDDDFRTNLTGLVVKMRDNGESIEQAAHFAEQTCARGRAEFDPEGAEIVGWVYGATYNGGGWTMGTRPPGELVREDVVPDELETAAPKGTEVVDDETETETETGTGTDTPVDGEGVDDDDAPESAGSGRRAAKKK